MCFWTKLQKNGNGNISVLCYNFWTNQNLAKFRPVKHVKMTVWTSLLWKINIHIAQKWPEMVITWSFIKGHSFPISLYLWFWIKYKTLWEGHKIRKNSPLLWCLLNNVKTSGRLFFEFLWAFQKTSTLSYFWSTFFCQICIYKI